MTREEAINILNALKFILNNDQYTDEIEEALDMAISALQQPNQFADGDKKDDHLREVTKMVDTISRQAAIDALGERPLAWTESEYETGLQNQWEADVDAIKAVPPAQPAGHWIFIGDGYKCSECGSVYSWWADSQTSNYCPNCGADMREGEA